MEADQIKAWAELAHAVTEFRWYLVAAIVIVLFGGGALFLIHRRMNIKDARDAEEAKEKRSSSFRDTINSMVTAVETMKEVQDATSMQLQTSIHTLATAVSAMQSAQSTQGQQHAEVVEGLTSMLSRVSSTMRSVAAKVEGKMTRDDSSRFVQHTFQRDTYRSISMVFEKSMTENDYLNRKEFVSRKVRTDLGDIMVDTREFLSSYPLSIDYKQYFLTSNETGSERFVLCDELWSKIEPLYQHTLPLKHRVEEAFLLIENTIRDYITRVYMSMQTSQSVPYNVFRTPLPGKKPESGLHAALAALPERPGAQSKLLIKRRLAGDGDDPPTPMPPSR